MSQHGSRSLCCSSCTSMPQGIVKTVPTQYQRPIALQNYMGCADATEAFTFIVRGLTVQSLRACIECCLLCMNSTEFCKMMDHLIAIVANLRGDKKGNAIFVFCLRGVKTTLNCRSAAETTVMDS